MPPGESGIAVRDLTCNGEFGRAKFSNIRLRDIDETRTQLSRLIRQHDMLSVGAAHSPTEVRYAPLLRMAVSSVRLGREMKVAAQPVNDSFLIFTALEDPFELIIGEEHVRVTYEKVAIVTPGMPFVLLGSECASSVVLDIQQCYLNSVIAREQDINLIAPLEFSCGSEGSERDDQTISRLMLFLRNELDRGSDQLRHAGYIEQLEDLVAGSLIYSGRHNYSEVLSAPVASAPRHVRLAIDYIHAHANDALTLPRLANVAASTSRSLIRGFQKYKNCSPMAYVRNVRIERAHEELLHGCPDRCSVTTIANRWGFYNPGRFARAYRERYGENPSDTLRRGSAGAPPGADRKTH